MDVNITFPPLLLSYNRKNTKWRKLHLDWADLKTLFNYSLVRKNVIHKKINYDLVNGKLHMHDLENIVNPDGIKSGFIPERIQHYPIINSKLNVLRGEESSRAFDWKVVVTNPTAISEIENNKKLELFTQLLSIILDLSLSEEDFNQLLEELNDYFTYEWLDFREVRANALLNHYSKEYNLPLLFNQGFMDALIVGEEIYQCDIIGGEPVMQRLNPMKVRVFRSGYSNKIEDADLIIIEDYWSPGKVIDTYYDVMSKKDIDYLEHMPEFLGQAATDSMNNIDERMGFVNNYMIGDEITSLEGFFWDPFGSYDGVNNSLLPYDMIGNIKVLKVYWKSKRRIKKVKSYDPDTGEENFTFYPETYVIDKDAGEEEEIYYINEAWEGTKIGLEIYVNMRPRIILYNRLNNPSRCHFGIVGSIYNLNDNRPYSLVDKMKPFNYLYDVIHDRLNKAIANNWGAILNLDLSKVPTGWDIEKWMYYAKVNHLMVVDSFKEGKIGASTGKLAGALNNAASGGFVLDLGNYIQSLVQILEYLKGEMSEVGGISKQREGQISNRETVGGVERATLQSSHITEWFFFMHDDVKKRALECFLETAKIACKGRTKKFPYILPDYSQQMMTIDGDEFAECDYGLVIDNSVNTLLLYQKMEVLALAAILNQYDLSIIMKMFTSSSLAEKQRMLEAYEQRMQQQQQQQQQQQMQLQQQLILAQQEALQQEFMFRDSINQRDNDTKIKVAEINSQAEFAILQLKNHMTEEDDGIQPMSEKEREEFKEKIRLFDEKLKLDREKVQITRDKVKEDTRLKEKQLEINRRKNNSNNK